MEERSGGFAICQDKKMNTWQIDCFLAVVRNDGFTKAASDLFLTQPSVSRQIVALEKELGITLFDRKVKKGVQLTRAGILFYELFERCEAEFNKTLSKAKSATFAADNRLVIASLLGWDVQLCCSNALNSFQLRHPEVKITIEQYDFRALRSVLRRNIADVVITFSGEFEIAPHYSVRTILDTPLILLYSKNRVNANEPAPTPEYFKNDIFYTVHTSEDHKSREKVVEFCRPYGFSPNIQTVPNIPSIISNVLCAHGVAIMDYCMQDRLNSAFHYIELSQRQEIVCIWHENNTNPAIPLFLYEFSI